MDLFAARDEDCTRTAKTFKGAMGNLAEVLGAILAAGLHLNPKKCALFKREIVFLGHIFGAHF